MFRQDGFIPMLWLPTVRGMKVWVEIVMSLGMLALWGAVVATTLEATPAPPASRAAAVVLPAGR